MTDKLLPCPFCGSRDVAQGSSRERISVWCTCGAQGPSVPFPENCIDPLRPILECHEAWNRRSAPTSETATPETVYFQFVRGDAFGKEANRLRVRKWDTKPFEGATEYTVSPSPQEQMEGAARTFMDLFVVDNGEERGLSVDDIDMTELTHRFAALEAAMAGTPPQEHTVTPIDRLEEIAKAQKAYHDQKQQEFPTVEDFLDDDGELHLPADIGPLLSQSSCNGRYSEADWWLSTIQKLKAEASGTPPENQMSGDIRAAATAAIKAAQDEITIDRIESSDNHSDMIRTAFIGAISSAILAERQRCAEIASSEAISRLNNEDGYPAARAHDFVVVARKIEREIFKGDSLDATRDLPKILPGPRDQSDRAGKRDRQRLQSAFKKGVKEGRRIEREAHQVHISTIAGQIKEQDSRDD